MKDFNYNKQTAEKYKNREIASTYHQQFTSPQNSKDILSSFVARYEKKAIKKLLNHCGKISSVIDLPAGTGKLAPILIPFNFQITSCDISEEMLQIAKEVYQNQDYKKVQFKIVDLQFAVNHLDRHDLMICLRLLHRVPLNIRVTMLEQISKIANLSIVSIAVENQWHVMRRKIREFVIPGTREELEEGYLKSKKLWKRN